MKGSDGKILFERVIERYRDQIASERFNGIKLQEVDEGLDDAALLDAVTALVIERKLDVLSSGAQLNPHIKRYRAPSVEAQLRHLNMGERYHTCLYPTAETIARHYDLSFLDPRPFSRKIAEGRPQLEPIFFEIGAIDRYRLDPRYEFVFSEYAGRISITDPHYSSAQTLERDKMSLQTFGLGMDRNSNPLVCVFLRYLAGLTSEHQQHWQSFVFTEHALMHENYYKPSILGEFYENNSGIAAIRFAVASINLICEHIWGAKLFLKPVPDAVHYNLSPFMRPTKSDYLSFAHELDKLISDNINPKFFDGRVSPYLLITHDDGTVERKSKGTLTQLEEWLLGDRTTPADLDGVRREVVKPLRRVRRERQPSAHEVIKNEFDLRYRTLKQEVLGDAAFALGNILFILMKHANAPVVRVPKWFEEGRIEVI